MNERECAQAYEWVLKQLQRLRALDLIGDIEATVAAGLVREEPVEKGAQFSVRVPYSASERLVLCLRLLVATASVPLMVAETSADW